MLGVTLKKIVIIGSGGTGKSTLGRKLSEKLGVNLYHLDKIHWKPNWERNDLTHFYNELDQILVKEEWIIDGNYFDSLERRMLHSDTIIFLDFGTLRCITNVIKRRISYHNKSRPDMTDGC